MRGVPLGTGRRVLSARGMTTREKQAGLLGIQAGLPEVYGVDVG